MADREHEQRHLEQQNPLLPPEILATDDVPFQPHPRRFFIMALMAMVIIIVDAGAAIENASLLQILKDDVCWRHYGTDGTDGTTINCDTAAITNEIALVNNVKNAIALVPGILMSVPMGMLADRIGRKPVVILSLFGLMVAETGDRIVCWWWNVFPTRLVWLSSLTNFLGGGSLVATSMVFTILADIVRPEQRAAIFYALMATALGTSILGGAIGAEFVARGHEWSMFLVSYITLLVGFIMAIFMPETFKPRTGVGSKLSQPGGLPPHSSISFGERALARVQTLIDSTAFMWTSKNILLLLWTFFVSPVSGNSVSLVVLYASQRFAISIGEASYLLPLFSSATLMVMIALPFATRILISRYNLSLARKDLILAASQTSLAILGLVMIAWAPTGWILVMGTVVLGLGAGYSMSIRSLVTSLVHQDHYATLFGAVGTISGLGSVCTSPLQALAFQRWIHLPFWIAAGLSVSALFAMCVVRLPKADSNVDAVTVAATAEEEVDLLQDD